MLQPFAPSPSRYFSVRHIRTPAAQCLDLWSLDLGKTLPVVTKQRVLRLAQEQCGRS